MERCFTPNEIRDLGKCRCTMISVVPNVSRHSKETHGGSAIRNFIRYNINASMPRHTDLGVK